MCWGLKLRVRINRQFWQDIRCNSMNNHLAGSNIRGIIRDNDNKRGIIYITAGE